MGFGGRVPARGAHSVSRRPTPGRGRGRGRGRGKGRGRVIRVRGRGRGRGRVSVAVPHRRAVVVGEDTEGLLLVAVKAWDIW